MDKKKIEEGKTMAIVSYITWIGLLVAFLVNSDKKNEFTKFHIRQALLLILASFLVPIPVVGWLFGIFLFILWIMGLVSAINGETKEMPVLGKFAQEWFKGL
ncbi:MAG: hypothetical protein KKF44_06620 [Nanoarchaeota archaeon]|nr:hypothetical protein [Nanoarchaeota archaeon]